MSEIDKLAWLYINDKKLLVARSRGRDSYYIPGGKREIGESDEQALIREIKEELSVDLKPETILYVETFKAEAHAKPNDIAVKMTCYFAEFEGDIKPDAEIEDVLWLSYQEKDKCSPVTKLIMDWLNAKELI